MTDKGYHSNKVLMTHADAEIRTYISEPDRGERNWEEGAVLYSQIQRHDCKNIFKPLLQSAA